MKYSIVIPTYNHLEDCLKPCVESVLRNSDMSETELVISANGCTDGTREYVQSIPNARLVWSDQPLGYTEATNKGIIAAIESQYIVLLNNDVVILDWQSKGDWLRMLEAPFADEKVGISGPSKLYFSPTNRTTGARKGQTDGDWFTIFFCAMIRSSLFETIGYLDPVFSPGYGEDIDFCFRAQKYGFKRVQIPQEESEWTYTCNFPIYHKAEGTFHETPEAATRSHAYFERGIGLVAQRWNAGYYRKA